MQENKTIVELRKKWNKKNNDNLTKKKGILHKENFGTRRTTIIQLESNSQSDTYMQKLVNLNALQKFPMRED